MESYGKILDCLLLREVIRYLPYKDQLRVRGVNKDWEDEAHAVLKKNNLHLIELSYTEKLNDFFVEFFPPSQPMRLIPTAKVIIRPDCIKFKRLKSFAIQYGASVQFLKIILPFNIPAWVEYSTKLILKHCVNLQILQISIVMTYSTMDTSMDDSETMATKADMGNCGIDELQIRTLEKLRKLTIFGYLSGVEILNEIFEAVPEKTKSKIMYIQNYGRCQIFGQDFLLKLKSLRLEYLYFAFKSNLFDEENVNERNLLMRGMIDTDLLATEIFISFKFSNPKEQQLEELKTFFQEFLNKPNRRRIPEITIALKGQTSEKIYFKLPQIMPRITELDLEGAIDISRFTQFPNLRTVKDNGAQSPFQAGAVFPSVQKLEKDVDGNSESKPRRTPAVALSESAHWSSHFPNIKILHTNIEKGSEGILKTIFGTLLNLEELKLVYRNRYRIHWIGEVITPDPESFWDSFTGGIRPVMDDNTLLEVVIPVPGAGSNTAIQAQGDVDSSSQQSPVSILNLQKLKILEFQHAPPCMFYAVVHLTATGKMNPLNKLKFVSRASEFNRTIPLDDPCRDMLESVHAIVILELKEYENSL